MKKLVLFLTRSILIVAINLTGCVPGLFKPVNTITPTASVTQTVTVTVTPTPSPTPTLAPTPTERVYESGYTIQSDKDGMNLHYVSAGDFIMGFPDLETTSPQITVYLDAFWIDETEVTIAMYQKCVESGTCTPPRYLVWWANSEHEYYGLEMYADYPVMSVDKNQSQAYCEWVGRNLPTEAQWEKAARGTDGRTYPWGNYITQDYANYGRGNEGPTKVGSYHSGVSPYGAYDMVGNVFEWVADRYTPYYYEESPLINPQGPDHGTHYIRRGGGWGNIEQNMPVYLRFHVDPSDDFKIYVTSWYGTGFRCAMDAT